MAASRSSGLSSQSPTAAAAVVVARNHLREAADGEHRERELDLVFAPPGLEVRPPRYRRRSPAAEVRERGRGAARGRREEDESNGRM